MGAGNSFLRFVCVEVATCAGVVMVVMQVNRDPAACFPDLINMAHLRQALATQTNSCFYCSSTHIGSICFCCLCYGYPSIRGKKLIGKTQLVHVIYNCLDRQSGKVAVKEFSAKYGNTDWVIQENRDQSCFCVGCKSAIVIKRCNWL